MADSKALFRTEDLGGGVSLHLHRTRSFKTVTTRLVFHADLDDQAASRALVPRVLARGTRRLPTLRDVQIELDRRYGAALDGGARKIGERQLVQFRSDWISDRLAGEPLLERMGALLGEYVSDPATNGDGGLRADVVVQERRLMAAEAAAIFDDKARYARRRLVETMCRTEAYARPAIGRLAEIEQLTPADVDGAWRRLVERAPVDLFLVGDVTVATARRFAKGLGLHRRTRTVRLKRTERRRPGRVRTVRESQDVGQAKLEMGFRTRIGRDSPHYPGLVVMNALFGGTPVGKLFKVVREKLSLCYSIHSATERTKGLLLVHAGIEEANYAKARRLIVRQLDELRAGHFGEAEMEMARGILISAVRTLRDSPQGIIEFALERAVNGQPADLDGVIGALAAVSARDVARAARTVELDTVYLLRS